MFAHPGSTGAAQLPLGSTDSEFRYNEQPPDRVVQSTITGLFPLATPAELPHSSQHPQASPSCVLGSSPPFSFWVSINSPVSSPVLFPIRILFHVVATSNLTLQISFLGLFCPTTTRFWERRKRSCIFDICFSS